MVEGIRGPSLQFTSMDGMCEHMLTLGQARGQVHGRCECTEDD